MTTPNWSGKSIDLIKEACRHGEARLAAQVQIATSADQRATVLAGIYAAAATGIIGALGLTSNNESSNISFFIGSLIASLAFFLGAICCIFATLPVQFWTPGNDPREWYSDIDKNTALEVAVGEQTAHFDDHIRENNKIIAKNARYFKIGALLGVGSPVLGILSAGVTCLISSF